MSEQSLRAALEKLAKWRKFFASWQLGTTSAQDGRYKAVAHHRELSILPWTSQGLALLILAVAFPHWPRR